MRGGNGKTEEIMGIKELERNRKRKYLYRLDGIALY
jgi:hypothetical protein